MEKHQDYPPQKVESEMQRQWREKRLFETRGEGKKEKFYCLSMFPYPSGALHVGHVRNYLIGDVISRHQRMLGRDVLQPMGWDAFGLPAENAAIARQISPASWTEGNIKAMREQLTRLGFAYDWRREFATCDPDYYRWEQWLFLRLMERGLAYRDVAEVNWDPVDQTVLANEQVIDGRGWRSGAAVERRAIPQWFLRITAFAEELLGGLDELDGWPEAVRAMQRNWIGRSEGARIRFALAGGGEVEVFTTRPDTLMGATFLALAAAHPAAVQAARDNPELARFAERQRGVPLAESAVEKLEKEGVDTGLVAIHPLTGEKLPVWAANYVLMSYGQGAVMCVPAHDQRDLDFALAHGLPVRQVIRPDILPDRDASEDALADGKAWTGAGKLINSGAFDGLDHREGGVAIVAELIERERGQSEVTYRLRDWGVSRQRYWGAPIPIIICPACGDVPVPDEQLPVLLPRDVSFNGQLSSPLPELESFWRAPCPRCGGDARRETDTFDTFVESSWYFARFACPDFHESMIDPAAAQRWLPVDQYVGGVEHAVLHLLYARFFHRAMRDIGLVEGDEPFRRLLTQGMVLRDGSKMSKSRGNTVDPQQLIDRYGADTTRLFVAFAAPPTQTMEWSDSGVAGASRFLRKLWRFCSRHFELLDELLDAGEIPPLRPHELDRAQRELRRLQHQTIARVGDDYGRRHMFNTAVAAIMELFNAVAAADRQLRAGQGLALRRDLVETLLLLLAPVAPHFCDWWWRAAGHEESICLAPWPQTDELALARDEIELVVQVDGKLRARLSAPAGIDEARARELALKDERVRRHLAGREVVRAIHVPDRLVSFVTRPA